MRRIWFALSVWTAGLILGTSSMAFAEKEPVVSADESQARKIWTRLRSAPDLEGDRIAVDVDDGIATLEGTVYSQQERKEAQQLAHVEGILGVNNRLRVYVPDR
jgi:osmotically-inducible protein OsmY